MKRRMTRSARASAFVGAAEVSSSRLQQGAVPMATKVMMRKMTRMIVAMILAMDSKGKIPPAEPAAGALSAAFGGTTRMMHSSMAAAQPVTEYRVVFAAAARYRIPVAVAALIPRWDRSVEESSALSQLRHQQVFRSAAGELDRF